MEWPFIFMMSATVRGVPSEAVEGEEDKEDGIAEETEREEEEDGFISGRVCVVAAAAVALRPSKAE